MWWVASAFTTLLLCCLYVLFIVSEYRIFSFYVVQVDVLNKVLQIPNQYLYPINCRALFYVRRRRRQKEGSEAQHNMVMLLTGNGEDSIESLNGHFIIIITRLTILSLPQSIHKKGVANKISSSRKSFEHEAGFLLFTYFTSLLKQTQQRLMMILVQKCSKRQLVNSHFGATRGIINQ